MGIIVLYSTQSRDYLLRDNIYYIDDVIFPRSSSLSPLSPPSLSPYHFVSLSLLSLLPRGLPVTARFVCLALSPYYFTLHKEYLLYKKGSVLTIYPEGASIANRTPILGFRGVSPGRDDGLGVGYEEGGELDKTSDQG